MKIRAKVYLFRGKRMKSLISIILLLILTCAVWSQDSTVTIIGRVSDRTGDGISNASVTATMAKCKCSDCRMTAPCSRCCAPQRVTTDSDGSFTIEVFPGTYEVVAEAAGFAPYRRENIKVFPGASQRLEIVVDAGASVEVVSVESSCDFFCRIKNLFKKIF